MRFPTGFRSSSIALIALCGAFAGLAPGAAAQPEVDFSRAPATGLKCKVVSKASNEASQSVRFGEQTMESTVKAEQTATYTDTVLAVKAGKITRLEREYEDVSTRQVMTSEQLPEPREMDRDGPLAWKHFRAEWNDAGEVTLKVKSGDEWGDPEDRVKEELRPARLRRGLFPLPAGARSVGYTWELDEQAIQDYFPPRRMRGRDGGEGPAVEQEVTGNLAFTEIAEYRGMKCAVIRAKLEIKAVVGEAGTTTTKLSQTCYYSLEHRVVVGMKGTSETAGKMSQSRGEMTMEMETNGKGTSETAVTIEQAGGPVAEQSGAERSGGE